MARPRENQISLQDTPYYHCVSRCVRRAFLCGIDHYTNQSYEHRRSWIEKRLLILASVFSIDICAYAVMSNHVHVVLRVDVDKARTWSNNDVLRSWHQLFKGTVLTQQFMRNEKLKPYELASVMASIEIYRSRLMNISWFMRALNEHIARQANREDKCTGRFWEGRFKSQALLDETAVLACMAYVDLNPVRAKIANTLEASDFTSIQLRIRAAIKGEQPKALLPFLGPEQLGLPVGLIFRTQDYLQLLEETSRMMKSDKQASINVESAKILERLNIPEENWLKMANDFSSMFKGAVGTLQEITRYCKHLQRRRRQGVSTCKRWFENRSA